MTNFVNLHPFVEGFAKTVAEKWEGLTKEEEGKNYFTTPQFFNMYKMCWFLTSETKVLNLQGELLHGKDKIIAGERALHRSLTMQPCEGPCSYVVTYEYPALFLDMTYKVVSV